MKPTPAVEALSSWEVLRRQGAENWRNFRELIKEVPGARHLDTDRVFHLPGAEPGKNLYTHLPWLFQHPDAELSPEQMGHLSQAALLLLSHTVLADRLVDRDRTIETAEGPRILATQGTLLCGWRKLQAAAGDRPLPWDRLLEIYTEYSDGVLAEALALAEGSIEAAHLNPLVSAKSALAKIIPVVMGSLAGKSAQAECLVQSLDSFHISSNLLDDMDDWKEDFGNGRFTYLLTTALRRMGAWPEAKTRQDPGFIERIGLMMYWTGVLEEYLDETEEWMERAIRESVPANCPLWTQYLILRRVRLGHRHIRMRCRARDLILERSTIRVSLGGRKPARNDGGARAERRTTVFPASVSGGGANAASFLMERLSQGGGLRDFWREDGADEILVSASAGSALHEWNQMHGDRRADAQLDGLRDRITAHCVAGCGAESGLVRRGDALAIAAAARFLLARVPPSHEGITAASRRLREFQRSDGSFSRYLPEPATADQPSWLTGQADTTAAAIPILGTAVSAQTLAVRALLAMRPSEAPWQPFWWSSTAFVNCAAMEALELAGQTLSPAEARCISHTVLGRQSDDGSWPCLLTGKPSVFETAWSVRLLMNARAGRQLLRAVLRGIEWLLSRQLSDGSWTTRPILRVPRGDDYEPWRHTGWSREPEERFGVVLHDSSRCFTTAAALGALAAFQALYGDRRIIMKAKAESRLRSGQQDGQLA